MAPQLLGFCRFSFFGRSDTQLDYSDTNRAFHTLYDERRMNSRFALLENLLLPSLKAQEDQDFRLIMLTSQVMPKPFRDRLRDVCADVPQIQIVEAEGTDITTELRRFTQQKWRGRNGLMQFRIDDDDALGRHYIARLRHWASAMPHRTILTMPKGLCLYRNDSGVHSTPMYRNLTAVGYAYFSKRQTGRTIFQFAHNKSGKRLPYISDPSFYAYLQSFTATSDTYKRALLRIREAQARAGVKPGQGHKHDVPGILEEHFPFLTVPKLKEIYALAQEEAADIPLAKQRLPG